MKILREGDEGVDVQRLQTRLFGLGFKPGVVDGKFGQGTKAALIAYQKSEGLLADGIAGAKTLAALGLKFTGKDFDIREVTPEVVKKILPGAPDANITTNLPILLAALKEVELADKNMILMALATIRAETSSFAPISEFKSKYNTSPGGHPFDLYDNRRDLGNQGTPDGDRYKGRGFIQLTGRNNYATHGRAIGLGNKLVTNPELANDPQIAARLLASFLKSKELRIREALHEGDLRQARRLVNGGSHGLEVFKKAFRAGEALLGE